MSSDEPDPFGGILDRLEHSSYDVDSSNNILETMEEIKSKSKNGSDVSEWIKIKKPDLLAMIVESYVDADKKMILNMITDTPATIPEILEKCDLQDTRGYRKFRFLVKSGLVKPVGYSTGQNQRKIKQYLTIIDDVKIYIDKDIVNVLVRFKKKIIQSSPHRVAN